MISSRIGKMGLGLWSGRREIQKREEAKKQSPQERVHQLVTPCRMVSPERMHTSNTTQSEQIAFIYLGVYMYIHICMQQQLVKIEVMLTIHLNKTKKKPYSTFKSVHEHTYIV